MLGPAVVLKITPHTVHAASVSEKGEASLGLIFRILVVILPELVDPMGKLALGSVLAIPVSNEVFTQFILELPVPVLPLLCR